MNTNNALIRVVAVATLVVVLTAATNLITGTDGPDNLLGTPGDDAIKGLAGADTMTGLSGNDTYYVENLGDQVVESTGGGTDTVRSTVRFILPPYVERLILTGARPISGTGNKLANRIVGNSNFNAIDGGPGNDVLLGSAGPDFFVFRSPLNASTNLDELPDFDVDADSIGLVYTAFPTFSWGFDSGCFGPLSYYLCLWPDQFHVGASATNTTQRIIYNPATGVLKYDSDGSGPNGAVRFALLPTDLALTSENFFYRPRTIL